MEPSLMLRTSSILLALTAVGGVTMAVIRFTGNQTNPPSWLAMAHGFLGAAGLTLLGYAWCAMLIPLSAAWALLLFAVAAGGGVVLNLGYHLKGAPLPKGLITGHAVIAVVAFALLLTAAWGGG